METGKNTFCLSLDTGKQSGTFRPLVTGKSHSASTHIIYDISVSIFMCLNVQIQYPCNKTDEKQIHLVSGPYTLIFNVYSFAFMFLYIKIVVQLDYNKCPDKVIDLLHQEANI